MSNISIHIDTINAMKQPHIERGYTEGAAYRMAIRELNAKHPDGYNIIIPNVDSNTGFVDVWAVTEEDAVVKRHYPIFEVAKE